MEYLPESRTFLLEDGISVGALFELTPAGTEARTPQFMAQLRDAIQTALTDAIPEDVRDTIIQQVPMGRMAMPDEIAYVVSFLTDDRNTYMTGANLPVNGGMYMT